jgi:SEC-C motif-containing protein
MAKFSPNSPCPCGSKSKYKKCCAIFHKGSSPKSAVELMKSRYSAYAIGNSSYIIKTTHPKNSEFSTDLLAWKKSIDAFCKSTEFLSLRILEFSENENSAIVKFEANLSSGVLREKSNFLKVNNQWLYLNGEFE